MTKNQDKINWYQLSTNPNAMLLLENNRNKIHWGYLCENINAISLLNEKKDIDWFYFSHRLLCNEIAYTSDCTKLDLSQLCNNPNAIPFFDKLYQSI